MSWPRSPWTPESEALLRRHYDGSSPAITALAEVTGFSRRQVICRARYLGLAERPHKGWTLAEERYLNRWFGLRPDAEIARKLGRSADSVRIHANRRGLSKRGARPGLPLCAVARICGVTPTTVRHWVDRGFLQAHRFGRGATSQTIWGVTDGALRGFLSRHPERVLPAKMDDPSGVYLALLQRSRSQAQQSNPGKEHVA